ncbi:hypothetical protein EJC49_20610 [Aquibium carbonis]|uniref:Secreted protein n=1 Tax=Aquibium carbonis TaxID=2495581 RepID=A0A3S0AQ72_9HYPH|nr:hypothetical protein [Aquibium carbonis]RST84507.1 hypothetical protein EJC49_20610 [Aquibium carbonis]
MRPLVIAVFCLATWNAIAEEAVAPAADSLWLTGVWGNVPGCAYHKGGSRDDDDSLFVLKSDGLESYVTGCDFLSVQRGNGASVATALCGHEGEDVLTAELVIIRDPWDPEDRTRRVTDAAGNPWAEVEPCE